MNDANNLIIQVAHHYPHPPAQVFDAWLDTELARKFLFATETGEIVRCDIDARVGGEFVITDRRSGDDVEHCGRYLELSRPHTLMFRFGIPAFSADEDLVTIKIAATDQGCELTLSTEISPQWAEYVDRARDGWRMILRSLEKCLPETPLNGRHLNSAD